MRLKNTCKLAVVGVSLLAMLTGCSSTGGDDSSTASGDSSTANDAGDNTAMSGTISVISREEGSGTRSAFIELFGIEEEDASGEKVDNTTEEAVTTNNTAAMITNVSGNPNAIGYVSLGSLNDTVKAVKIDGNEATAENVKAGTYKVSRPFNIVTKTDGVSELAQDFINYIMSTDGQAIVEEEGYVPMDTTDKYSSNGATGTLTVGGSSSVAPVMEKLAEAYEAVNTDADVQVTTTDSSTGVTSTIEGSYDIGMASRAVKDEEVSQGVTGTQIAIDGVAVIVNNENTMDNLTSDQVKNIFTGSVTDWSEVA